MGGSASDGNSGEVEIWMAASIAKSTCLDTSYCSVGASARSLSTSSASSSLVVAEAVTAGGVLLMLALEVPMTSLSVFVDAVNIDDPPDEFDVSLKNGSWKTRFRTSPFPRRDLCLSRKMLGGIGMGRRLH